MSLHIYFEGVDSLPDMPVELDAEAFFSKVRLDGCDYDRTILSSIENGRFVDNSEFIDRFGRTLPRKFLCTGSKIAFILYHVPNVIINGAELGCNALVEVAKSCHAGALLLPATNYHVPCEFDDVEIDVVCKGRHYTSLDAFSEYMMEEAPYD